MPKFVYQDTEQKTFELVPEGDYLLEITEVECEISTGAKTRGCDQLVLEMRFASKPSVTFKTWVTLPGEGTEAKLAKDLQGMVDTMLRALNYLGGLKKGQAVELSAETMIGLRGWAHVIVDVYPKPILHEGRPVMENGKPKTEDRKNNKIHYWITNKDKVERNEPPHPPTPETEPETATDGSLW